MCPYVFCSGFEKANLPDLLNSRHIGEASKCLLWEWTT